MPLMGTENKTLLHVRHTFPIILVGDQVSGDQAFKVAAYGS